MQNVSGYIPMYRKKLKSKTIKTFTHTLGQGQEKPSAQLLRLQALLPQLETPQ